MVGNRPQFIKSGPTSVALRERGIEEIVVHTGQHYDRELSQVFFDELDLPPPGYSLDLHTAAVERMQPAIAEVVETERPDWVLVYGDTNSTLAGARAAGERRIAHVEAGLRSGDLTMPEEHNRIEVDLLSSLLLTPDERSRHVLLDEGVLVDRRGRARVRREHDRFGQTVQAVDDAREPLRPHVGLAVDRRHRIAARLEIQCRQDRRAFPRDRREAEIRVGHDVADDLDPAVHALAPQHLGGAGVRTEKER